MVDKRIKLNGDFIVATKVEAVKTQTFGKFQVFSDGIEKEVYRYRIEDIRMKNKEEFPFFIGDEVISGSTGTIVKLDDSKYWLFKPEHILAKLIVRK